MILSDEARKQFVAVNRAGLKAKLKRLEGAAQLSAVEATRLLGNTFVDYVERTAPRDTNRYVAGWMEAANAAGLGPRTVPKIKPSELREKVYHRFEDQVSFWNRIAQQWKSRAEQWERLYNTRYVQTGRKGKYEQEARAELAKRKKYAAKAAKLAERAKDEFEALKANPTATIIFGKGKKKGLKDEDDVRLGRLHTVRVPIYGGDGQRLLVNGQVYYRLHNKEAHASIVESRHHTVKTALAIVGIAGVRRAKREVRDTLRRAAKAG